MATAARQQRGMFRVDENAALAELERAWADGGYHGFSADDGTWSAISSAGEALTGDTPDALIQKIRGALAGDAVMSHMHALVPASAQARTCRVCGLADPPPDLTCLVGQDLVNHRVGTVAGCPHCGRLREACARRPYFGSMNEAGRAKAQLVVRLSRLAQRLVMRPAAGRADQ